MLRLFPVLLLSFTLSAQLKRFQFSENKMGSPFNIIFYYDDSVRAISIAKECFSIIDSVNNIFSDYSLTSEVSRLSHQTIKEHEISDELFKMIVKSIEAWKKSGKTFDITIGALTQLWRKARNEKSFPSVAEIKKAKSLTGFENLIVNTQLKTISFKKKGVGLDFGGIVPGYAAQKVIDFLRSKNISIALADASGDIVMSESPPGKSGWLVGINIPESEDRLWDKKLELKNCAVSTSGDVYRFIVHNGNKYSHIIDPRTGYGVTSQRNVTVIAKDGTTSDWLATACSILPVYKALALAKKEKAALLIATLINNRLVFYKTENFDSYFQKEE